MDHDLFVVTGNHFSSLIFVKVDNVILAYYADSSPVPPVIDFLIISRRFSQNENHLFEFLGLALSSDGEGFAFLRTEGLRDGVVFIRLFV